MSDVVLASLLLMLPAMPFVIQMEVSHVVLELELAGLLPEYAMDFTQLTLARKTPLFTVIFF